MNSKVEQHKWNSKVESSNFFITKFVLSIHLAANDEERRGKDPERQRKNTIYISYLEIREEDNIP